MLAEHLLSCTQTPLAARVVPIIGDPGLPYRAEISVLQPGGLYWHYEERITLILDRYVDARS